MEKESVVLLRATQELQLLLLFSEQLREWVSFQMSGVKDSRNDIKSLLHIQNNMPSKMQPRCIKNKQEIREEFSFYSFREFYLRSSEKRIPTFIVWEEIKALQFTEDKKLCIYLSDTAPKDVEMAELIKVTKYLPSSGQQTFFVMKYESRFSSYSQENYFYELCKSKDHICSPRCLHVKC